MIAVLENPEIRQRACPISVEGYHMLRDWGVLAIKSELIRGVVVDKLSKSPLHEYLVAMLLEFLRQNLPEGFCIRKEGPLTLADSEPEPDISVVPGTARDFITSHPTHAELVVEVAVSSLALDREKAGIYAAAGIPVYWLVDAEARRVLVFRQPSADGYRQQRVETERLASPFGVVLDLASLFAATNH